MRRWVLATATLIAGIGIVLLTTALVFPPPEIMDEAVAWSEPMGTERQGFEQVASRALAAAGDTLVYSEGSSLTGLDPLTGAIRWKVTGAPAQEGWIGESSLIGQEDRVIVLSKSAVTAYDPETGEEIWTYSQEGTFLHSLAPAPSRLAFSVESLQGSDRFVIVLDPQTGLERWRLQPDTGFPLLAADDEHLYVGSSRTVGSTDEGQEEVESSLVAYELTNGGELWRARFEGWIELEALPGSLVVRTQGEILDEILALEPGSGREAWRRDMARDFRGDPTGLLSLETAGRDLLVLESFGEQGDPGSLELVAVDPPTGEELWRLQLEGERVSGLAAGVGGGVALTSTFPEGLVASGFSTANGDQQWSRTLEAASFGTPVVLGETAFVVAGSGVLHALTLDDGEPLWSIRPPSGQRTASGPALRRDRVYFAGSGGLMQALDAGDGSTVWRARVGLLGFSQPVFGEDSALVVTGLGAVGAYAIETGDELWKTDNRFDSISEALSPAMVGDTLVAASGTQVWALTSDNGAERWEFEAESSIIGVTSEGGRVFVADEGGDVRSIDIGDGTIRWEVRISPTLLAGPVSRRGAVLVVEPDGTLHALEGETGASRWSSSIDGLISEPAIAGRAVVVAAGTGLHGLDLETGAVMWELDLEQALVGSPAISGDFAYVSSAAGAVLVIDARRGELVDRLEAGEAPVTSPVVGNGTAYVVTNSGNLVALR